VLEVEHINVVCNKRTRVTPRVQKQQESHHQVFALFRLLDEQELTAVKTG
jgi:hypothetical protein